MKKGIIFTGAQGTGKTTVLEGLPKICNKFLRGAEIPIEFITEVVRRLNKSQNIKINEGGDEVGQDTIFNKYISEFNNFLDCHYDKGFISDRGLTDVFAYTTWLYQNGNISKEFYKKQEKELKNWLKKYKDNIIFCYFPIEFGLVKDGVRSENEEFRNKIDKIIKGILDKYVKDYFIIEGTVEERINTIQTLY